MLRRLRNRIYSDPRFQRWASSFPLTRRIARKHANAVFDLTAGFVYSRVLEACFSLNLLERVRDEAMSVADLASELDLPLDGCERLLEAAAGIELVERDRSGRYGLGSFGALVLGHPGLKAMVLHHRLLHRDLQDPVALLRREHKTELRAFWTYAGSEDALMREEYSALMSDSLRMLSADVLRAFPMDRFEHVMDIGGGDGTFLRAVAEHAPHVRCTLFDLPEVAAMARERSGDSIDVVAGNLFEDPLPTGADCITLVRVLLDHGDESARAILVAARKAIAPGGTVVVAEPMRNTGARRMTDTYFGVYLWAMGQGQTRTPQAVAELLRDAGFRAPRAVPSHRSLSCHLVVARA
ncbi:MAG: methyltransferase [Myxococcota bacterium]